jgi:ATP-dependent exoDNAse (exonuclease V) beta subunit
VHAILRDAGLGADEKSLHALAESHGRSVGASEADITAAVAASAAALAHPLVVRASTSQRLHREFPVTLEVEPGRLLEGTIDLAYFDGLRWTIVDFKTDADLSAKRTQYERQLQWYSLALSRITGQPVEAVLLSI